MKYIKYEDLLDHNKIRVVDIQLKPNSKMTEVEWFEHMISGCILKVTDTLEEMCDEFVSKDFERIIKKEELKQYRKTNVMGAIWTDEGLIYIAKFNEKGEWKLL